jgi:predicted PurR-regulated permease PerM
MQPTRISFGVLLAVLVVTGWLGLGSLLLAVLFSYYTLRKLDFFHGQRKWIAITTFLILLGGAAYAFAFFLNATVSALPGIAEKSVPAITQWAAQHHIVLPFTDFENLKEQALNVASSGAKNLGRFADFARGATTQFLYLTVGVLVAIGLFVDSRLEMDRRTGAARHNLYSLCCEEVERRLATFYESFNVAMNAQVVISALNAALTGLFMLALHLPHLVVAVGVTLIAGMVPFLGNLVSAVMVVAIAFIESPTKGLAAVGFLMVVHYLEFMVGGKIIGDRIRSPLWLTLVALVVGDQLMGVTGMVLSPVVLHYIRIEASKFPAHPTHSPKN